MVSLSMLKPTYSFIERMLPLLTAQMSGEGCLSIEKHRDDRVKVRLNA